jgi:hypothetical protein
MAGLEGVIRPFAGVGVGPDVIRKPGAVDTPPVRWSVGLVGGQKMFAYSGNSSLTSYMATVHTEKTSDAFDMTTGQLAE